MHASISGIPNTMTTITLVAALFSLGLIFLVLWANPHRFSNQIFAFVLLVQTAWLACVYRAMVVGLKTPYDSVSLEWWFRANAAVISLLPTAMWLLKSAIMSGKCRKLETLYASWPIFCVSIISVLLCYTETFVLHNQDGTLARGETYFSYSMVSFLIYILCVTHVVAELSRSTGIRRIELQFLALTAGCTALILLSLNTVGNYLNNRTLNRLSIILVLLATALTAAALLRYRVFNAREAFLQFAHRVWFALILSGGIFGLWRITANLLPEPFGVLLSVAVASPIAFWIDRKTRSWFDNSAEALSSLRQRAYEIECSTRDTDDLIQRFQAFLRTEFEASEAYFLTGLEKVSPNHHALMIQGTVEHQCICALAWATPESLDRRRTTSATKILKSFLEAHSLGAVIALPSSGTEPSLVVGLGKRYDERPFTFPEIERIRIVLNIIQGVVARSRRVENTTHKAHTELVLDMSCGLAHDLKNLITPISSFLVHMEQRFQKHVLDTDVYTSAKRAVRRITDYVSNALSLPNRSAYCFETVSTKELVAGVVELMSPFAAERGVQICVTKSLDNALLGDRILLERMLTNVVRNAIEASRPGQTVCVDKCEAGTMWVRFEVRDEGCGIPDEYISRVFERSFTTKDNAESRSFGLGLTIARQVAMLHGGQIRLESKPANTRVYIDLPAQQGPGVGQAEFRQPSLA